MKVKLKLDSWLWHGSDLEPVTSKEIYISVPEGECILEVVSNFVKEDPVFWKNFYDERDHIILQNVIVILNNRIVNPYNREETILKDGDELIFLPMFDGG